jgi:hypothetical protein
MEVEVVSGVLPASAETTWNWRPTGVRA